MIRGISEDILRRVYDFSDMTDEELRCKFFQKLQECIELCNNSSDILEWLKNEGLEKEVKDLLTIWLEDGTLENLINIDKLNKKVDTETFNNAITTINEQLDNKTNEINKISINNFFDKLKRSNSKFIGHRGINDVYPENSLLGIVEACKIGYFGVEFDVICSADEEFIIIHDDTIDRTTNGTGYVDSMTLAQLKEYDITKGSGNPSMYTPLKIPTLNEIFQATMQYKTMLCIELKNVWNRDRIVRLLNLINKYKIKSKVMILAFEKSYLSIIREIDKDIIIALNGDINIDNINICSSWGNSLISTTGNYVTTSLCEYAHSNNVGVISYFAQNFTDSQAGFEKGVDLMTTNYLIGGVN